MEKCSKCGSIISDNDPMAWKCTECGKAFRVNLSKLRKLQALKDKPENTGKSLLKCSACGNGIDNGNEKIACKCSACGNIMMGKLKDFRDSDATTHTTENKAINMPVTIRDISKDFIKCNNCGNNIPSNSKFCPECGYSITAMKKKKSNKFKTVLICLPIIFILFITPIILILLGIIKNPFENKSTSKNIGTDIHIEDNVSKVSNDITTFTSSDKITQDTFNNIYSEYMALTDEEKSKIDNYSELEKYINVDIDTVNNLKNKILKLKTLSFSEIISIKKQYEELSTKEQEYIDITIVESKVKLSDIEQAAIAACKCVIDSLKNGSSFELENVEVQDDINGTSKYYLVQLTYSATNSFGGRIDDNSFQTISSDFSNPWWPLSFINGDFEPALKCSSFLQYYNSEYAETLDVEKITYYLNNE